jgi:transposase
LEKRRIRGAAQLAAAAAEAAGRQTVAISGEAAASVIARLAQTILELDRQLAVIDRETAAIFHTQADAAIITSLTGIGDVLGAELLAAISGFLAGFASADHLASYAGLAPMPRDSGYRTGNLCRPQRYNRQLQRVFYMSAMISIQRSPASKAFYDGKRAPGKRHTQAVIALAHRRVNLLWAMLRDHQPYQERQQTPSLAA